MFIRNLQRQIDTALKLQQENEREITLMRQRLTNTKTQVAIDRIASSSSRVSSEQEIQYQQTAPPPPPPPPTNSASSTRSGRSGNSDLVANMPPARRVQQISAPSSSQPPVPPARSVSNPRPIQSGSGIASTTSSHSAGMEEVNVPLPSTLHSAKDDLHDVIQAISGITPVMTNNPMNTGGVENTSSLPRTTPPVPTSLTASLAAPIPQTRPPPRTGVATNNLIQRLAGLSSVLLNESSISHHSSSSSGSSSSSDAAGVGGILNITSSSSSGSSSSSSLTTSPAPVAGTTSSSNIEKRLQAIVARTMQQTASDVILPTRK